MPSIKDMATGIVEGAFKGKALPVSGTESLILPAEGLINTKLIDADHPDQGLVDTEGAKGAVYKAVASALGEERKTQTGEISEAIVTGANAAVRDITKKVRTR